MAVAHRALGTAVAAALLPLTVRMLVALAGFATPLPPGNRRTVVTAAILVALLGAFVPALAIALLVLGVGACLVTGHVAVRPPAQPHRGGLDRRAVALERSPLPTDPGRLLLEVGAVVEGPQRNPLWQSALLLPAGIRCRPGVRHRALVVAAVLGLLPGHPPRRPAPGLVQPSWPELPAPRSGGSPLAHGQRAWFDQPVAPGPVPAPRRRPRQLSRPRSPLCRATPPRRMWGRGLIAVLALAPLLVGGWWLTEGESLVTRQDPGVVSPFVSVASVGPDAPRSFWLASAVTAR